MQGKLYYVQENNQSFQQAQINSSWSGSGAKKLGLEGIVKKDDFSNLLSGCLPNGERFRTKKPTRDEYKERGGIDCTFSAPKSVSILALVEGRKDLEKAHQTAVEKTLQVLESRYATTRVRIGNERQIINTENLVIAKFQHDISRELDPQLHTHCVLLNMTQLKNGKWYSLRNRDIHAHKKLLGMIYQNELAIAVGQLGYEIEQKGNGQFEIKGFSSEQLQSFSKRRQQIQTAIPSEATWLEREKAWYKTRIAKGKPIPRELLQDCWREELGDVSYPQPNPNQFIVPKQDINQAVSEAIAHLGERKVAFKPEEIEQFVLSEVGKYQPQEVEEAISKSNELIHLDGKVTTQTALLREINTIRLVKQGQERVQALTTPSAVEESLLGSSLTEGQKKAVSLAATTQDRFIAWSGQAGVGKTYALNEFKQIAEGEGYTVKGFAPSAKAAKVLSEEISIETTTVARKLVSQSLKEESQQQQIWIVDEAGLLGAKNALELLQRAKSENARVLLVGDTRQLSSVAAGNPFKSLQQAGITTAYLNQSLQQKTKDLKQAVDLISDGKIAEGIEILDSNKRIAEIQDRDERVNRIALDYLKLSPDERNRTLIIAGTHQEREALLAKIREGLKQEGTLGEEVTIKRLKSKNLTDIQKKYPHYYLKGNVVIPLANYKRLGLQKNQQYQVKAIERDSLILLDYAGIERRVAPASFKYKEVYEAVETKIAVGDRLRWGKNDKQLNRVKGSEFVVTQIAEGSATICTETGKQERIDLKTPQHLDHALVSTTYSSQGVTANRVFVSATNDFTLSQESFYVAASRAKYNLQLYVENRANLVEKAQSSRAQSNPLELIGEHRLHLVVETRYSTPQQQPNQTSQQDHEPNQPTQSNSQRDSGRSPESSQPKARKFRVEPPELKAWARGLSDGINQFTEQQEIEQLKGSIERINRNLKNSQFPTGRTEAIRNSIEQIDRAITKHNRKSKLEAIILHVEQSTLESDIELINAISSLQHSLETQSFNTRNKLQNLQDSINKLSQRQAESRIQPFSPPTPDDSKWSEVKDYLVNKRGLPESLVSSLHELGSIYADSKQNAVFIRRNLEGRRDSAFSRRSFLRRSHSVPAVSRQGREVTVGEITGASLRGTHEDSKFKGLAPGIHRAQGWFTLKKGQGELERIVLTSSPIDALSAAAISQKQETTLFISTDGELPHQFLQQQLSQGKQILVAYDNDEAGNQMARAILDKLPGSERITPKVGKDWNEQLRLEEAEQIAKKVQLLLQKFGQTSAVDGSKSFEGKCLRFLATNNSRSIYSKLRQQVIFEVNKDKNRIFYQPNRAERKILDKLKQNPILNQSPRRKLGRGM